MLRATGHIFTVERNRGPEQDRAVKRSTLTEYRHAADRLVRDIGDLPLEDVTPEVLERCAW